MGEHGLDQLKIPCVTVGKPFEKRNAGFAGVVTALSASKSYEVIPKKRLKSKYHFNFLLC